MIAQFSAKIPTAESNLKIQPVLFCIVPIKFQEIYSRTGSFSSCCTGTSSSFITFRIDNE